MRKVRPHDNDWTNVTQIRFLQRAPFLWQCYINRTIARPKKLNEENGMLNYGKKNLGQHIYGSIKQTTWLLNQLFKEEL